MAESNSQNRVIVGAVLSPIESLPLELISRIIYFLAEERFVVTWGWSTNNYVDLVSLSVVSSTFRVLAERALYKRIQIVSSEQLAYFAQMDSNDYRFTFITSLLLELTTASEYSDALSSIQISQVARFLSHTPQLTYLHTCSSSVTFQEVVLPILASQKNLEFLMLDVLDEDAELNENGHCEVDISIADIPSLLSLKELLVWPMINDRSRGGDLAKFFGTSPRFNLKTLIMHRTSSSQIYRSLQYFPALEELTIDLCDDLNLIQSLPATLKKLTLRYSFEGGIIVQFKDYQPPLLTHLSIVEGFSVTAEELDNLRYLPASILEFRIQINYNSENVAMRDALKRYRVGELKFKKFIFQNFGLEESAAEAETLWNEVVVECERLGVGVERE